MYRVLLDKDLLLLISYFKIKPSLSGNANFVMDKAKLYLVQLNFWKDIRVVLLTHKVGNVANFVFPHIFPVFFFACTN